MNTINQSKEKNLFNTISDTKKNIFGLPNRIQKKKKSQNQSIST